MNPAMTYSVILAVLLLSLAVVGRTAQVEEVKREKRGLGIPLEVELECDPYGSNASFVPIKEDCQSYYQCVHGWPVVQYCPYGTIWTQYSKDDGRCESPENAQNEACGFVYVPPEEPHAVPSSGACDVYCRGKHDECIAYGEVCDGVAHCYDGSDEEGCAATCDPHTCRLPNCRCSDTAIPGDLYPEKTPQMVVLTFEGAVRLEDYRHLYSQILNRLGHNRRREPRINPNGCRIGVTFFDIHQFTDFAVVQALYSSGAEIASLSLSHTIPASYWKEATEETWKYEIADHRQTLAYLANVNPQDVKGMRAPYLQLGGNSQFNMLHKAGFLWDNSWPTQQMNPPLWPYTLEFRSTQECVVPPCPTASFPGVWEVPLVDYLDTNDTVCAEVDNCFLPRDKDEALYLLQSNFDRHYHTNRAPFPIHVRPRWFRENHYNLIALQEFIDSLLGRDDVWFVTVSQAIRWIQNPTPVGQGLDQIFSCGYAQERPPLCRNPNLCGYQNVTLHPNSYEHPGDRYFHTCADCPLTYPWVGNPVGKLTTPHRQSVASYLDTPTHQNPSPAYQPQVHTPAPTYPDEVIYRVVF